MLQNENHDFAATIKELASKLEHQSFSLHAANAKIEDLENERGSLMTAIRLLNSENCATSLNTVTQGSNRETNDGSDQWSTIAHQKHNNKKESKPQGNRPKPKSPETTEAKRQSQIRHDKKNSNGCSWRLNDIPNQRTTSGKSTWPPRCSQEFPGSHS